MTRRLRWVLSIAGCVSLLTAAVVMPQPASADAGSGGGDLALSGQVSFDGNEDGEGFPCQLPAPGETPCEATMNGDLVGSLAGQDGDGVPWALAVNDRDDVETTFTYMDEIGGAAPMCTMSFGSGTGTFTATAANEAFGLYQNASPPAIPESIFEARGTFTYGWRAIGTTMLFHVREFTLDVLVNNVGWVTVLDHETSQNGVSGGGVLIPNGPEPIDPVQTLVNCATTGERAPLTATTVWNFTLSDLAA